MADDDQVLALQLIHLPLGGRQEDVDRRAGFDLLLQIAGGAEVVAERHAGMRRHEAAPELLRHALEADRDRQGHVLCARPGRGEQHDREADPEDAS